MSRPLGTASADRKVDPQARFAALGPVPARDDLGGNLDAVDEEGRVVTRAVDQQVGLDLLDQLGQ
jgi:hypothetical protein